jgi:DivIVA domain-containing protein
MEWFIALIAVVALGFAAVAASGRLGQFGPAPTDRPEPQFPPGRLSSADIDKLGFAVVPRGYAMDQVDEFCERVKARLAELEGAAWGPPLGASGLEPGIIGADQVPDEAEVMASHGSDETADR